jgi:hypothetical protein
MSDASEFVFRFALRLLLRCMCVHYISGIALIDSPVSYPIPGYTRETFSDISAILLKYFTLKFISDEF